MRKKQENQENHKIFRIQKNKVFLEKERFHEAEFYNKLKSKKVQCSLCPRNCIIEEGERGNCGVRQNINGKLYSIVYGKPCSVALDPIEKKPLYHFLPGEKALSIATSGCNLHCMFCQNWEISQGKPEQVSQLNMPPKKVVEEAKKAKSRIVCYTYTEPTIFYEYMHDTAVIAKNQNLKNVEVSNGFIQQEPLKKICKFIDGVNIDLKGNDKFYRKITGAWAEPILEALKTYQKMGVWIEITNLIIPTLNDKNSDLKWIINWIKENLGVNVPLHFSAFWPTYKLMNYPSTSIERLRSARQMALKAGLNFVYTGNLPDKDGDSTFCPSCKRLLIERIGFYVNKNNMINGKCQFCNEKIPGVWE